MQTGGVIIGLTATLAQTMLLTLVAMDLKYIGPSPTFEQSLLFIKSQLPYNLILFFHFISVPAILRNKRYESKKSIYIYV